MCVFTVLGKPPTKITVYNTMVRYSIRIKETWNRDESLENSRWHQVNLVVEKDK